MSEQKFQEAKSNLAFSQSLMDQLRGGSQPDMQQSQGGAPQETPQESPQEEQQEQKGIIQGVVDAITPMFDKLAQTFKKQEQAVELKIDGTMTPKTDTESATEDTSEPKEE